jgi:signal transduction histidine kinase
MKRAGWTAWVVFGTTVLLLGIAVVVASRDGRAADVAIILPVMLAFAVVGAIVAERHPRNPVGWLFLAQGAIGSLVEVTSEYATLGAARTPHLAGASWFAWAFAVLLNTSFPLLTISLLLFPDGHAPTRRWRPVVVAAAAAGAAGAVLTAIADTNLTTNFPRLTDPVRLVATSTARTIYGGILGLEPLLFLLAAVGLMLRMRRARGDERQQLKWIAFATGVSAAALAATAILPLGIEPVIAFIVVVPSIPIAAGMAISKYRLYEIDVVISKTVAYGVLAAFITVVYVGIVVGIGTAIGDRGNEALSLAATAIVALAFQPAREHVRRFANRLVYGERATPYEVVAGFARRVSGTLSVDHVLPEMAEAAARGVGAAWARVLLFLPDGNRREVVWPEGAVPTDGRVSRAIDVRYQGEPIGAIAVEKRASEGLTPSEDRLLGDLATQAGLALHNVRLTEELSVRLRELAEQSAALQVSRERLVTARDAQRRGLERDIREGPQRHLTEIGRRIRDIAAAVDDDPAEAERVLDQLGARANATLEGLRDLARGIFPPLLADKGIAAALEAHIRKVGANVTIEPSVAFGERRYDADVEACVYFCCLQAIQNVIRHADNAPALVRLDVVGDAISFSVGDEGSGFDAAGTPRGMGLQIMQDRVDALDGELIVESTPGAGTTVSGRIPAAAPAGAAR